MAFLTNTLSNKKSIPEQDKKWERFERKFFVSSLKETFIRRMLAHICLPDRKYPRGRINSLYFDTHDLDMYQKSDDGNYERYKIRIRWYDNASEQKGDVPVYLELKAKKGFASRKKRRKFLVPAKRLNMLSENNTIIDRNILTQTLAEFGYFSDDPIVPVILVTYDRFRYVEIMTGTRLSLDWSINSTLINRRFGPGQPALALNGSIIEIKGPSMDIPLTIQPLGFTDIDWTRFSKYASCIESQTETPGSVGLTWPSGRIESF